MKKIVMIIMAMLVVPVFAAKMCAVNDSVVVVLDPTISPSDHTWNYNTMSWSVIASYGTVSGVTACLNVGEGYSQGQHVAELQDTDNNGLTKPVVGAERYGRYCWCKMTHPAVSHWVFFKDFGSGASCDSTCGASNYANCGSAVKGTVMRTGMFSSITE